MQYSILLIDDLNFQILLSRFNNNILIKRKGFPVFISEQEIKSKYSMSVSVSQELNSYYCIYSNIIKRLENLKFFL
jgi:hypothetical protein